MRRFVLALAALALGALPALAQAGGEVAIVDVNTARYADQGQTSMVVELRNLGAEADSAQLQITANGEPVSDLEAASIRQSAVALGLVLAIDVSEHMAGDPLDAAKAAAQELVSSATTGDQVALITFADEVRVLSGLSSNSSIVNQQISGIETVTESEEGNTTLNDAISQGVSILSALSARDLVGNVVVITGSGDVGSETSQDQTSAAVAEAGVRVLGLGLELPEASFSPLQQMISGSGGLFASTSEPDELLALAGLLDRELDNTLVARFLSPVFTPGVVDFEVGYAGVTASIQSTISGFATTTTTGPTTSTTLAPVQPRVIESPLPLDAPTLILIGVAGIGLTVFLFMVILFGREGEDAATRFSKRLQAYGRRGTPAEEKKSLLERIPLLNRFTQAAEEEVKRRGLLSGVNSTLEQANVPMAPGEAILALLGLAAVGGVFVAIVYGPVVGGVVFAGMIVLSVVLIRFAGRREKKRFEDQLPDTLTLMSTSLRAGYSLLQATEAVAAEAPNPTSREFGRAIAEARLGMTVSDSLNGIAERTQSADFEWAVMAIEIQREVGGNLAEVLSTVADTMRARNRIKGEIRALTAEGRISAVVLGALPFVMALFLWTTNRSYLEPLIETTFGRVSIAVGVLLMAAGIWWLKKIVDIEI